MKIRSTMAALALLLGGSAAQAEPLTIAGRADASWSAYFTSDHFRTHGLRCGTDSMRERLAPRAQRMMAPGAEDCGLDLTNPSDDYATTNLYEITVVVHRFESLTGDGVYPDSLIRTQIDVLNEDFRALAGTPGGPGSDTGIRFRLATEDPDGNPHPGWTRTTNDFWFNDLPDPANGFYYDALAWDPHRYLNVYTLSPVAPGGLVLGYVPFLPQDGGVGTNEDGVRCLWNAFGRPSANSPYDGGRTVTHEVGHWIGLYHTFQDGCGDGTQPGCYSSGDRLCDTEAESEEHFGCETESATCGDPDPVRNYMDYSDDACMNNFTVEQSRRIRCTARFYRPDVYREQVVAVAEAAPRPGARLAQNRPNPFAASTELAFELPRAGEVSLVVLDVAGRVVRTLVSSSLPEGRHRYAWDGADEARGSAPAGVYFYRLATGAGVETRRMIRLE